MDLAKLYRRVLCKTWRARMERAKESCTGGLGLASERRRDPDLASACPDLQQGEHLLPGCWHVIKLPCAMQSAELTQSV